MDGPQASKLLNLVSGECIVQPVHWSGRLPVRVELSTEMLSPEAGGGLPANQLLVKPPSNLISCSSTYNGVCVVGVTTWVGVFIQLINFLWKKNNPMFYPPWKEVVPRQDVPINGRFCRVIMTTHLPPPPLTFSSTITHPTPSQAASSVLPNHAG